MMMPPIGNIVCPRRRSLGRYTWLRDGSPISYLRDQGIGVVIDDEEEPSPCTKTCHIKTHPQSTTMKMGFWLDNTKTCSSICKYLNRNVPFIGTISGVECNCKKECVVSGICTK